MENTVALPLIDNDIWYNYNKLLSYNAILNIIVGMRGGGKTYGFKKWCVRDFLRNGNQFVYVRRFKTELDEALKDFFGALRNDKDLLEEFGEIEYNVSGAVFYINQEVAGVGIALTGATKYKSGEYPRVNKIGFDEFLVEGHGHYLKDEVKLLYGLIETIQRHRDNIRVVLIANSVAFANPYFREFKIKPTKTDYLHLKQRSVVVHFYFNEKFAQHKQATRFGKLIQGTSYENYAIYNEFKDLTNAFVEKKGKSARFRCVVRYNGYDIGFWLDNDKGILYASDDVDPSGKDRYVLTNEDHDVDYMLIDNYRATHFYEIRQYYSYGRMRFEDDLVKSRVLEMLLYFK